jgi:hypothetical protein
MQLKTAMMGPSRIMQPQMRGLVKVISNDMVANVFKGESGRPSKAIPGKNSQRNDVAVSSSYNNCS